LIKRLFR